MAVTGRKTMLFQGGWTGAAGTAGHIKMKRESRAEPTGTDGRERLGQTQQA